MNYQLLVRPIRYFDHLTSRRCDSVQRSELKLSTDSGSVCGGRAVQAHVRLDVVVEDLHLLEYRVVFGLEAPLIAEELKIHDCFWEVESVWCENGRFFVSDGKNRYEWFPASPDGTLRRINRRRFDSSLFGNPYISPSRAILSSGLI